MVKAFLSHSSRDKKRYVDFVAKQLGGNCIYDQISFEEGMSNYEEIISGLDKSDLFVLFISNDSLNSKWVKEEIINSYDRLNNGQIQRIFPIIIDPSVTYKDERIPEWMRVEYNLQYISRPKLAARRILQRLIEISWEYSPSIKKRQTLFVGRNEQINLVEERFDSFDIKRPNCVFVCGIEKIGRRSFIKNALTKCSITKESYTYTSIPLDINESIEDFIIKIYDLGFSEQIDTRSLLFKTLEEKIEIVLNLFQDIKTSKEIVQIIDKGCLVSPSGELVNWFERIIKELDDEDDYLYLCIISNYRIFRPYLLVEEMFSINISELTLKERIGLFKRYGEIKNIEFTNDILRTLQNTLLGFPEQVFYCVDFISSQGLDEFKRNPNIIIEYNTEKVKALISQYEENSDSFDLLVLLSEFDFISIEFLNEFISLKEAYIGIIKEFSINGICEHIGAAKEYVRLNDSIKDYISRTRSEIPDEFKLLINKHAESFVESITEDEQDLSEVIFTVKNALKKGKDIPKEYLIPSHFLKTINDLYNKGKKVGPIIELADRVLENSSFMDKHIENEIRYMLCLSLARSGNTDRFYKEVEELRKEDRLYLLGFFYRLSGNLSLAKEKIMSFLDVRKNAIKGRRELIQIYIDLEDFESAIIYAKELYENEKLNPYNILAYVRCLFKVKPVDYQYIIEGLIKDLEFINTDISLEMHFSLKAEYVATFEGNYEKALSLIDECIGKYPDNPYPLLTKIEICERNRLTDEMDATILRLKTRHKGSANSYTNTIYILESKLMALRGNTIEAIRLVESKLKNKIPQESFNKLIEKMRQY